VQALIRWDPAGFAESERAARIELRLPPAWRVAELVGHPDDVGSFMEVLELPPSGRILGPVAVADSRRSGRGEPAQRVRALVSATHDDGQALSAACKAAASVRSAAKAGGAVTVRLDPVSLG